MVPSSRSLSEGPFVIQALRLLIYLDQLDRELATLLMMYYSEGDGEVEQLIMQYFISKGVTDPHEYFPRELNLRLASPEFTISEVLTKSKELFDQWTEEYYISKGGRPTKSNIPKKTFRTRGKPQGKTASPSIPVYNPVEVINYFVIMEHERELARLVSGAT